ncbi:MAG: sulfotransferase [Rhodoplanes sp.]
MSGLPRSGSTLLAALLRQNPRLHANVASPIAGLFLAMLREMSAGESAIFIDDSQREAMLRGLFISYYHTIHPFKTIIDNNRLWCAKLPAILRLFPNAKVICCVRDVPWIVDSIERLVRKNRYLASRIFDHDPSGTVFSRADAITGQGGLVGFAWHAIKQAYYSEEADRMLVVRYESLTTDPARVLAEIYAFTGLPSYAHDFENVDFDVREFDARLATPGLHDVRRKIAPCERASVLPPDLFRRFTADSFWNDPNLNDRRVRVI